MPQLRLALAQVNATVGDLAGNAARVRDWAARGRPGRAPGGLPRDVPHRLPGRGPRPAPLVRRRLRAALHRLAADLAADGLGDLPVVVGYLDHARGRDAELAELTEEGELSEDGSTGIPKGMPQDCAAVLYDGRVVARYAKHHLPNYGVFDEFRIFVPGHELTVVRVRGVDVALAVCEDLWQDGGPVAKTRHAGAELLLVVNASPYERSKDDTRLALTSRRAARPAARWPTSTWSAARTSWSSTATPSSSTSAATCWPAGRSSGRTCWSSTSS